MSYPSAILKLQIVKLKSKSLNNCIRVKTHNFKRPSLPKGCLLPWPLPCKNYFVSRVILAVKVEGTPPQDHFHSDTNYKDSHNSQSYYIHSYNILEGKALEENQAKEETHRVDLGRFQMLSSSVKLTILLSMCDSKALKAHLTFSVQNFYWIIIT